VTVLRTSVPRTTNLARPYPTVPIFYLRSLISLLSPPSTRNLDLMSFADACKALEAASRLGQQAAARETNDPAASSRGLRDQLEALLDQAYGETLSQTGAAGQPKPATSTQAQL